MNRKLQTGLLISAALLMCCDIAHADRRSAMVRSTMGENTHTGLGVITLDEKQSFDASSNEVLWFGEFKLWQIAASAGLEAEWITPAGEVFKRSAFKPFYFNISFAWAKLDIKGKDKQALEIEGEWTVKIYWDKELLDEKQFFIGKRQFRQIASPDPVDTEELGTYEANIKLAKAFHTKKKTSKVIAYLKTAKKIDSKNPQAYTLLGGVYNSVNEPEKAIIEFSKSEELGGDAFEIARGIGYSYFIMELYDDALKSLGKALELRPGNEGVVSLMEKIASKQGE